MEFTKDAVLQNWITLNTSQDTKLKSNANNYLTAFKQCSKVIPICGELFQIATTDQSIKFFSSLLIYQYIKENIATIAEEKESFNNYKQFLFIAMLPLLQGCSDIVISNVCQSLTILVLVGKVTYWPESIDDILQLSNTSELNCSCALMILEYFYKELEEMKLDIKVSIRIRVECIDSRDKVKKFLMTLIKKISLDTNEKTNEALFKHLLRMTQAWIKFKLNVLSIDNFALILMNNLHKDFRAIIAEVLSDCFQYSSISVSSFMSKYPNEMIYDILSTHADRGELNIIYQTIMIINSLSNDYSNRNTEVIADVLFQIAIIFSSLCKNYIYLFFLPDNDTSNLLWALFFFFISNNKRRISYLFFESIDEMKNLINQHRILEFCTETQRDLYREFFFKINEAILSIGKLASLDVDYEGIAKKETTSTINMSNTDLMYILQNDDTSNDLADITILDYRTAAEDALSDLFLIFLYNYSNGIQIYLERLSLMVSTPTDQSIDDILNNKDYLKLVEVVLFNIRSIRYCFDLPGIDSSMLLNFSNFILHSQLIRNEKIMVNFIIFLDSISLYVHKNTMLYQNSIQLLLSVILKSKVLEKICALVILNIVDNSNAFDPKVNEMIGQVYFKAYNALSSNALSHLSESLVKNIIKNKEAEEDNVVSFVIKLLQPVSLDNISDRNSLMKIIEIYSIVIKTIGLFNKAILNSILAQSNNSIFALCEIMIVKYANNDSELIKSIVLLYVNICHYLKEHCLNFFDRINQAIFSIYSSSKETYEVIYIMKALYTEAIKNKASSYSSEVIEKFCSICYQIHQVIYSIAKTKLETIQLFASFMSLMLEHIQSFPDKCFDYDIMDKVINMFIECNNRIAEIEPNTIIIRLFGKICSSGAIPIDFKLKYIASFILCGVLNLKHCDTSSVRDLSVLFIEARNVDIDLFNKGIKENIENDIADLILQYFTSFGSLNCRNKIERLIMEVIDIKKGTKKDNALNVFSKELQIGQLTDINHQQ